ncbi:MAG: RluA family pseudouridine synthase [Bacilli bacterium]|nr:RluA family pseudouridine synthase [Bacilli bacterium]
MKLVVKKEAELLNYLYENLAMSKKKVKSFLTHGDIYIDHQKVTQYNFKLFPGMIIMIQHKNNKNFLFDILYEDDFILVVDKPSGLLTIASEKEKRNTLYHYVLEYLQKKNRSNRVFIVHRLDQDTSGIVIFAKNQNIKNKLQKDWNTLAKVRGYQAVVEGRLKKNKDKLVHHLLETKTNLVYVSKSQRGKEAITNYQVEKENSCYSLLNIQIETGRKNQIRVQLSHIGNPIVGDSKYGKKEKKFSRLYLHANKLVLFHPILKKKMTFESANPKEFSKVI